MPIDAISNLVWNRYANQGRPSILNTIIDVKYSQLLLLLIFYFLFFLETEGRQANAMFLSSREESFPNFCIT